MTIRVFLWCHIRYLNPLKSHPERITNQIKRLLMILIIKILLYAVFNKDFSKIEKKNYISINVLCFENGLAYPAHIPNKKLLKFVWIYY